MLLSERGVLLCPRVMSLNALQVHPIRRAPRCSRATWELGSLAVAQQRKMSMTVSTMWLWKWHFNTFTVDTWYNRSFRMVMYVYIRCHVCLMHKPLGHFWNKGTFSQFLELLEFLFFCTAGNEDNNRSYSVGLRDVFKVLLQGGYSPRTRGAMSDVSVLW